STSASESTSYGGAVTRARSWDAAYRTARKGSKAGTAPSLPGPVLDSVRPLALQAFAQKGGPNPEPRSACARLRLAGPRPLLPRHDRHRLVGEATRQERRRLLHRRGQDAVVAERYLAPHVRVL